MYMYIYLHINLDARYHFESVAFDWSCVLITPSLSLLRSGNEDKDGGDEGLENTSNQQSCLEVDFLMNFGAEKDPGKEEEDVS